MCGYVNSRHDLAVGDAQITPNAGMCPELNHQATVVKSRRTLPYRKRPIQIKILGRPQQRK